VFTATEPPFRTIWQKIPKSRAVEILQRPIDSHIPHMYTTRAYRVCSILPMVRNCFTAPGAQTARGLPLRCFSWLSACGPRSEDPLEVAGRAEDACLLSACRV